MQAVTLAQLQPGDGARHHLIDVLNETRKFYALKTLSEYWASKYGRNLHNDLQAVLGDMVETRHDLSTILLGRDTQLPWAAFLEQLAIGAAYAQQDDLSDAKGKDGRTNLAKIIRDAGYASLPLVRGRWGLQFRMFRPVPGMKPNLVQPRMTPIIAFRGTEGVQMPWTKPLGPDREGMVDTYIADFSQMGAGYPQVLGNMKLITRNAQALGQSMMVGHSLGGGIAQIVTARLPQYTAGCVTFSAPGIKHEDAESLKGRRIPTTHYRTSGDIVPIGNDEAAPGTIVTYDRFVASKNGQGWRPDRSPTTTHNSMPIHTSLNLQQPGKFIPMEKQILNQGVSGPTKEDNEGRTVSVVSGLYDTQHDPARHAGAHALLPGVTHDVYMANIGYNLMVEYAESEVQKLDPARLSQPVIRQRLQALASRIAGLSQLAMTDDAMKLYRSLGMDAIGISQAGDPDFYQNLKAGQPIKVPVEDRRLIAAQVPGTWLAWWPGERL